MAGLLRNIAKSEYMAIFNITTIPLSDIRALKS